MNAPSADVAVQLDKAKRFHDSVIKRNGKYLVVIDFRKHIFVSLYDMVLEHHGAIITLVESGQHYGSALALLRPLVEASLRALWILYCATEEDLVQLAEDKRQFPSLESCRSAVSKRFPTQHHLASLLSHNFFNNLHDLTHTGMGALKFRFDEDGVHKPSYPDQVVSDTLMRATTFLMRMVRTYIEMVQEAGDISQSDSDQLAQMYLELYGPPSEGTAPNP